MRLFFILACALLGPAAASSAQTDETAAVRAVIDRLFDGMRLADTTMVSSAFAPNALLGSIGRSNDPNVVVHTPAKSFVTGVGRPRADVWDERIDQVDIRVDGNMASAWVPYAFYVGDTFSHCGVNSIQFAKVNERWQITYLIDTRRKDSCIVK